MTENICSIIIVEIERIKNQVSIFSKKKKSSKKKSYTLMKQQTRTVGHNYIICAKFNSTQARYYVMY